MQRLKAVNFFLEQDSIKSYHRVRSSLQSSLARDDKMLCFDLINTFIIVKARTDVLLIVYNIGRFK